MMRLLQSSFRTLGTMEKENKKLKLKFRTCIQVKPILSTIEKYDGPFIDENAEGFNYEMQVRLEGQMTAYSCKDWAVWVRDKEKSPSHKEVSSWLRDAIASGEVEIELVNEPTPINYQDREAFERLMEEEQSRRSIRTQIWRDKEFTRQCQDGNAYNGASGIGPDGETF